MDDHIPSHLLKFTEDYYSDEDLEKQLENAMFKHEMTKKHPPLNRSIRRKIKAEIGNKIKRNDLANKCKLEF